MYDDKILEEIGHTVHDARVRKRMTTRELSEATGFSKSSISRYENGKDCSLRKFRVICDALGLNYDTVVKHAINTVVNLEERLTVAAAQSDNTILTNDEEDLLAAYHHLNAEQKQIVLSLVKSFRR